MNIPYVGFSDKIRIEVGQSLKAIGVVNVLNRVTKHYGKPKMIRVDNDSEFVSKEVDL